MRRHDDIARIGGRFVKFLGVTRDGAIVLLVGEGADKGTQGVRRLRRFIEPQLPGNGISTLGGRDIGLESRKRLFGEGLFVGFKQEPR